MKTQEMRCRRRSGGLRRAAVCLLLGALAASLAACGFGGGNRNRPKVQRTTFALDTIITISLYDSAEEQLVRDCFTLCGSYEKIFSRTDPGSELARFNRSGGEWVEISEDLSTLLQEALQIQDESKGAFDVGMGHLSDLWNFGGRAAEDPLPDPEQLLALAAHTGYQDGSAMVELSEDGRQARLLDPETEIDLGAIAKGYIADRLADYLVSKGVGRAVISLGGNVLCIGDKPDGTGFTIGIQYPFGEADEMAYVLSVRDASVVTSGIYERCVEKDGVRYHHILDPETGSSYQNGLLSVTILAPESVDADALSTTCFALGLEEGLRFAEESGVQAIFLTDQHEAYLTENFDEQMIIRQDDRITRERLSGRFGGMDSDT